MPDVLRVTITGLCHHYIVTLFCAVPLLGLGVVLCMYYSSKCIPIYSSKWLVTYQNIHLYI